MKRRIPKDSINEQVEDVEFDAREVAGLLMATVGKTVAGWPPNASLRPLIVQLRNLITTLERMENKRA